MTEPITAHIPHTLGREEAKRRIQNGAGDLSSFVPGGAVSGERWEDDAFFFTMGIMGKEIPCRIDAYDDVVVATVDLPPMLAPVAGMIRKTLEKIGPKMLN